MPTEDSALLAANPEAITRLLEVAEICSDPARPRSEVLDAILDAAIAISGADRGNVQLFHTEDGTLRIAAQRGFEEPFLTFFARVAAEDRAACGAAMKGRSPVTVEDVASSPLFAGHASLGVLRDAGVRAVVSTPVLGSGGRLLGMISAHWQEPHRLAPETGRSLELLARFAALSLELRESRRGETDTDRRKNDLVALLAHELRNPLGPILNSTLVLRRKGLSGDVERAVRVIERQALAMSRLLDDLLAFSRATHDRMQLRLQRLEVFELVMTTVDTCRHLIETQHQRLHVVVPENVGVLVGDRDRLMQVIGNLLVNASKFTPEMGRIEVAVRRRSDALEIAIADDGIGIPAGKLDAIFQPWIQLDRANGAEGLGIGLSLAREIVSRHHGTIEARSGGTGRGSTFTVRLPLDLTPPA